MSNFNYSQPLNFAFSTCVSYYSSFWGFFLAFSCKDSKPKDAGFRFQRDAAIQSACTNQISGNNLFKVLFHLIIMFWI